MAQLQSSGAISIRNVNSLKRAGDTANTALREREQAYMHPSGTWNQNTGVCMPNDVVIVADAADNTGTLARNINGSWVYSAPTVVAGTPIWGPHSLKEFYSAYTGVPSCSLGKTATGVSGNFNLTVSVGGEFTSSPSNYFINVNDGGWQTLPANPWVTNRSAGTYTVKVRDYLNCGSDGTISCSITYP